MRMNTVLWVGMVVLALGVAGWYHSWLLAWFVYALGGLVLLALSVVTRPALLQRASRRMSVAHAEVDQEVAVAVTLTWDRPLGGGWVLAQDSLPSAVRMITPPGRLFVNTSTTETDYTYRLAGRARGYYPIGPLAVTCGDLFGIAARTSSVEERDFLTIYPVVHPVAPLRLPSNRPIGEVRTTRRLSDDPTRMVGVREYVPGDTFSRIHWKTTARTGTLSSKIYEPSTTVEVTLVLNLSQADYPEARAVELACSTAASLAASLLSERQSVGLQSNGLDIAWRYRKTNRRGGDLVEVRHDRTSAHLPQILALLGRLEPSGDRPLAAYLSDIHSKLPWTATLLLITHGLEEEAVTMLEELKRAGFALAILIVGTGEMAEAAQERAAALGVPQSTIQSEAHLAVLDFQRTW
jgi:uncharacterized protein (DUF58 family)